MRTVAIVLFTCVLSAATARASNSNDKFCTLAASSKLPRIPGIEIVSTRTLDPPKKYRGTNAVTSRLVEIDTKAAGQAATFSYICMTQPGEQSVVEPIGIR